MTDESTPKIYLPKYPPDKSDLLRLRNDLDSIVQEYKVLDGECSFRYYITTRYLLESLGDMTFEESNNHSSSTTEGDN